MPEGIKLPKDTRPAAVQRVAEANAQSMLEAKVEVLARTRCEDFTVAAIVNIAGKLNTVNRNRVVETLRLIALLDCTSSVFTDELKRKALAERPGVLRLYQAAISRHVPAREIVDKESAEALVKNPAGQRATRHATQLKHARQHTRWRILRQGLPERVPSPRGSGSRITVTAETGRSQQVTALGKTSPVFAPKTEEDALRHELRQACDPEGPTRRNSA